MAPMKYEEQLKDKLEQRTIQPSADSWYKLSEWLDAEAPRKHRKGFWYLGIAASIVGILLITNMFNNGTSNTVAPVIVDTNTNTDTQDDQENKSVKTETLSNTTVVSEVVATNSAEADAVKHKEAAKKPVVKDEIKKEQLKLVANNPEKAIVAEHTEQLEKETINPLSIEEQKAREVVAQIQSMQQIKEVTDAEIDALLNAAQRDIAFKKLYNENTKTIDASALLSSVEDEIEEQSFRARVFEMLKTGYNEVKTVVAERNN